VVLISFVRLALLLQTSWLQRIYCQMRINL
jgi:hypothetical protein